MRQFLLSAALIGLSSSLAWAGPVADGEAGLRQAYAAYRTALFASNSGNAEATAKAIDAFTTGWASWSADATKLPQYEDDALLVQTVANVSDHAAKAAEATKAGNLAEAHEALEGIRDEIGGMHLRNGIVSFSDRMNAYHAQMEAVLALDPASLEGAGLERMAEMTGVLAYLAADIAAHPAPEAAADDYAPLAGAFQASVAALVEAVRSGDAAAVKAAVGGLKVPYSKFFVKFG